MKRSITLAIALLALGVAPATAQKVQVDWDQSVDFNKYETFAWARTPEASLQDTSPLMHSRIKNAIEYQLTTGGMIEDTESPDVYVTYHGEHESKVNFNTMDYGYGYGRGWRWGGGMGSSTTTVSEYDVGTLVIDIWDAETRQMIWRGTATKTIPEKPEKQAKLIDESVAKLAREWEKKYTRGKN
jgi:hypothetical protein